MGLIFFTKYPERVNNYIFPSEGAYPYKRHLQTIEFHLLDTAYLPWKRKGVRSQRTGFYFCVLQEGEVGAADTPELISRDDHLITVADLTQVYTREKNNPDLLHQAAQLEALPESWRDYFQEQTRRQDVR
jgi:hypothetical protein